MVAPFCHGTNSHSPRPWASDFDCSPEATLAIVSNISCHQQPNKKILFKLSINTG